MDEKHAEFSIARPVSDADALRLHPMSLAFIGDAVQSLYVRTYVTLGSDSKTGALHKTVTKSVSAVAQAGIAETVLPLFDEREADIFRRARNCHIQTSAKHAERAEYRRASGLEAVIGYLYITGKTERLQTILDKTTEGLQ